MLRQAVSSSVIKEVRYDQKSGVMYVLFNNNRVYQYLSVPFSAYHELVTAPSVGSRFNQMRRERRYESAEMNIEEFNALGPESGVQFGFALIEGEVANVVGWF